MANEGKIHLTIVSTQNNFTYYPKEERFFQANVPIQAAKYVRENLSENVVSIETDKTRVAFHSYGSVVFIASAPKEFTQNLLLILINNVRLVVTFLLGPDFEEHMSGNNISLMLQRLVEKYIDLYLDGLSKNFNQIIKIVPFQKINGSIAEAVTSITDENYFSDFVECFMFVDMKLVGRFTKDNCLSEDDTFRIALLVQIEYGGDNQSTGVRSKRTNLDLNGNPQVCLLSLSTFSNCVLVVVSKGSSLNDEKTQKIHSIMRQVEGIYAAVEVPLVVNHTLLVRGMIHFLIINRKTGEYWESPPSTEYDGQLRQRMIAIGIDALANGNILYVKNEKAFQFTYEMIFFSNSQRREYLQDQFKPPKLTSDGSFNFRQIIKDNFPNPDDVFCFEMMTVHLGVISTKNVLNANSSLFHPLTGW